MLKFCGVCYMCLSVWGIVQLFVMGILYRVESIGLIEDTEAHESESLQDFLDKTTNNYKSVSTNCFIAGSIYIVILGLGYVCFYFGSKKEKAKEAALLDDATSCTFQDDQLTDKQRKKIT